MRQFALLIIFLVIGSRPASAAVEVPVEAPPVQIGDPSDDHEDRPLDPVPIDVSGDWESITPGANMNTTAGEDWPTGDYQSPENPISEGEMLKEIHEALLANERYKAETEYEERIGRRMVWEIVVGILLGCLCLCLAFAVGMSIGHGRGWVHGFNERASMLPDPTESD